MSQSVNELNTNIDLTVRVFDEFYNFGIDVPANEYDVVVTFFEKVYKNREAAESFAISLFRIAQQTGQNVMTLLAQLQDGDSVRLTASLSYYLNGLRSPSTLLGIQTPVVPNSWAARNVLP